jgi:S-(hydroxymethyl)glutathione dehydrogenase/alcohol dehydrogenase
MVASGVCHSDLHVIQGNIREHPMPVVLGHEGSGIVEEVGPEVTYAKPGDHVVLSLIPICGQCSQCIGGRHNLCEARYLVRGTLTDGTTRLSKGDQRIYHLSGLATFAEYAVVPEDSLVLVRGDAPLDKLCLIGCAVSTGVGAAIHIAKVQPGNKVVVIGVGGVGLNIVQGAALAGAEIIVAVDIKETKLKHALEFGATHLVNASTEDVVARVTNITNGLMADYAFEAIGSAEAISQGIFTTRRGGVMVAVGDPPAGSQVTIDAGYLHHDRILMGCINGSCYPRADVPKFVDLYMAGKLKLDELITHEFGLEEINTAFDLLDRGEVARAIIRYT